MKITFGIIISITFVCIAVWYLYPRGEAADWKRLQKILVQPGKRASDDFTTDKFPNRSDKEKGGKQVMAIRTFAQNYPESPYIQTIIHEYE